MGELTTLAKARQELEDLYCGVPDESVNLTFEDLAQIKQQHGVGEVERKTSNMKPTQEIDIKDASTKKKDIKDALGALGRSPSLDFNRGLHGCKPHQQNDVDRYDQIYVAQEHEMVHISRGNHNHHVEDDRMYHPSRGLHHHAEIDRTRGSRGHHHHGHEDRMHTPLGRHHHVEENTRPSNPRMNMVLNNLDRSLAYDDMSGISINTTSRYQERGGRRRAGIPHSNICTICSTYIYIFRHRCLVCGRVYCRQCVSVGMGEMTEGRKCVACLGRRFSQRYIHRAGAVGCCSSYPSIAKQQELKWAEKGPRGSGPRGYGGISGVMPRSKDPVTPSMSTRAKEGGPATPMSSRSRSPVTPRTPTVGVHDSDLPSFVMNSSQYAPYSPAHRPF